jgi:molecular chaperone DnaK
VPQIEVTFDIDANGIVHVSAKDLGTGKEQSMTITGGSALPKEDIDRMMREAQEHADEDRQRREEAETRNLAEQAQWQTERFLAESGEKLPEDSRSKVNEALTSLRSALGGSDLATIKSAHEALNSAMQEASTALYAQTGATTEAGSGAGAGAAGAGPAAGASAGTGQGGAEDVVDAEIVDDEDDKK